ncbi:MAG: PD-(D/E)XK nuclease family transposase [Bacilli bacterium]|nr:PD-(D/E)XK nuclease family transposase [Bacilli bacterium]
MTTFYTCRNDRAFKEVFLNPNNSDLLKALLEFILKIKIDKLEIKKTELLSGNVNIKDKRVDAIVHTGNKKIEIEINSQNKDYLHTRSTAYICNIY